MPLTISKSDERDDGRVEMRELRFVVGFIKRPELSLSLEDDVLFVTWSSSVTAFRCDSYCLATMS